MIITSATLDAERFARHFGDGNDERTGDRRRGTDVSRSRCATARWCAATTSEADDEEALEEAIVAAAEDLWREASGRHPGVPARRARDPRDRRALVAQPRAAAVRARRWRSCRCSRGCRWSSSNSVFAPSRGRRIVLATNVAETSLTVPGIRYVIDSGLARIKRYSLRNKVTLLQIEKISQAAANQRAGRCGRVAAGVCVRLYDDDRLRRASRAIPSLRSCARRWPR